MDVLVTGATGYLGRHVVDHLSLAGRAVAGVSRSAPVASSEIAHHRGDLTDPVFLSGLLSSLQPRTVIHLAGSLGTAGDRALIEDNILATIRLLTAVTEAERSPRIVLASSSAVYAPTTQPIAETANTAPTTLYGVTKLAQEHAGAVLSRTSGSRIAIARLFNLVGPGQRADFVLGSIARQIAEAELRGGGTVTLRNAATLRDFVDVRDAARAIVMLGEAGDEDGPFNVATGQPRSIRDAFERLRGHATCEIALETVEPSAQAGDVTTQTGNAGRLHRATGWTPSIPFEDSLQALLDSWRAALRRERDG